MFSRTPCPAPAQRILAGFFVFALTLLLAAPSAAQQDLTPYDVLMQTSVTGVYPSPDGGQIVFTRSVPRGPEDGPGGGYASLHLLTESGEEELLNEKSNISGLAWMPDGSALTFVSGREGGGSQLYALDPSLGEVRRAFDLPGGLSTYRVHPTGSVVAFTSSLGPPADRAQAREAGFRQRIYDEDWNPIGLFTWSEDDGEARQIEIPGSVYGLEWSPDGSRLLAAIAPRALTDDFYMFQRLHLVDVASGAVVKLVENPGKLGQIGWSPDGSAIAYLSAVDARDPHAGMLYMADAETGEVTALTPGFQGMVHSFEWLEADKMRLIVSRGAESRVTDFSIADRTFTDLPGIEGAFTSVHTAGDAVVATVSAPSHPPEVYALTGSTWSRRTDSNPMLADVDLSRQEVYSFTARDGVEVEGILMYPLGFEEGTRYPMVMAIHGGPEAHYNNSWLTGYGTWGQLLSRKGFFVWFPNYRSSTGRGVAYAKDDHGDLAGTEFDDQVDAIDHFVGRGWVDRDRVGLGGASYGGYAGAWAATKQTEHFAAAVAMVPITHVATKYLTTDIPWEYYFVHYEEAWPFEQWDYMEARSPLTYAPQSRTPLLLAGGTADPRVHPSQPFMLYRAVKETTRTPVRYVQYPGEGHGNRLNVYRYDYLVRTLRWFEYYLRPGNHRSDPLPPLDLDYSEWLNGR